MNIQTKSKRNEKLQFLANILTELGCGRAHRKYERPFVRRSFTWFVRNLHQQEKGNIIPKYPSEYETDYGSSIQGYYGSNSIQR